jgi:hypothetical protein
MKNLDENVKAKALEAIKSNDAEEQAKGIEMYFEALSNEVTEKFNEVAGSNDVAVLNSRGIRQLTSDEKKYYEKLISTMRTSQSLSDIDNVLPKTVIDQVFEDLEKEHPLLSKIDFVNVTGLTEFLVRNGDVESAWWGKLTDAISKELASAFKKENVTTYKLSAFLPVCKAHLDLGPSWLDTFVRRCLVEALALGLEDAIVTGTGKDMPIGMDRDLNGAVVEGVYPQKTGITFKDFKPATVGAFIASLTNGGKRKVTSVIMLVNPVDYYAKIMPNVLYQNAQGVYVPSLPFPIEFIQSTAVAQNSAIFGLADKYFLGIGSTQKIEASDEYHFLEDERVYLGKMYGTGKPKDNASFIVLDITDMPSEAVVETSI